MIRYDVVLLPSQFAPRIFLGRQLPEARNVGQPDSFSMHYAQPTLYAVCIGDGGKCSAKISGIPYTIGSTRPEARKGIHHLGAPVRATYPLSIFPTIAHLNLISRTLGFANFAFFHSVFPLPEGNWERGQTFSESATRKSTTVGTYVCRKMSTLERLELKATSDAARRELGNLICHFLFTTIIAIACYRRGKKNSCKIEKFSNFSSIIIFFKYHYLNRSTR